MVMRQRRHAGAALAALAWALITLVTPPAAQASAVCPSAPHTLAGLIAPDAEEIGALTQEFRPVYGVYPESAAACWPGDEISVSAFVASPEGLGGTTPFSIEPAWLVPGWSRYLSATDVIDPEIGPTGPFLPVAVPPSLQSAFDSLDRRWVRVSGHFSDRAARTCVVTTSDPGLGAVPSAEEAIAICRTSFVLTDVQPTDAPATDTGPLRDSARPSVWLGLGLAAITALVFGLMLLRPSRHRPLTRGERSTRLG